MLVSIDICKNLFRKNETTDYYPYGQEIPLTGTSYNQFKYNSKELQTDAKLDWYDYGARFYDPVLGRWQAVDPLAEKYFNWSPYNYVGDNPIRFIDPNGEDGWDVAKGVGTVLGGTLLWVGGVTLITTGVGAGVGVASIMAGSGAIGCGVAQIVDGAANDGKNNVPSGLGELVAANADKAFGNENGELRKIGAVSDLAISIAIGGIPKPTDVISTLSAGSQINSVVSTAEVLYDDGTFYKKSSEQSQSEEKTTKKLMKMEYQNHHCSQMLNLLIFSTFGCGTQVKEAFINYV